ncbi:hypothetical protein E2C01_039526 [Portunus trituberculatus]|uniref:Uncharacterized protein n=1 Tax=Portunus trituberculatus TaxID=210409 RepID=A0A5B7FDV7_PORTR|nr:hypothetical protein [Portunus trituberculatus]
MFWDTRSLPQKSQEIKEHLKETLPTILRVCEIWLTPQLTLHLSGYNIIRQDHPQGHGGGVLLAFVTHLPTHTYPSAMARRTHFNCCCQGLPSKGVVYFNSMLQPRQDYTSGTRALLLPASPDHHNG